MWNAKFYTPVATYFKDKLNIQDTQLTNGGVVYILDFGGNNQYIGSTLNLKNRLKQHVECLKENRHTNKMQFAQEVSGVFNVYILLYLPSASEEDLREAEKSMIHLLHPRLNEQIPMNSSLKVNRMWSKVELIGSKKECDGSYKRTYKSVTSNPNEKCPHCGKPINITIEFL